MHVENDIIIVSTIRTECWKNFNKKMRTILIILIKCFLLLPTVTSIGGLRQINKLNFFSVNQRTMKMIFESCYENDSFYNPIIIFGDFNEVIDGASIIRINGSLKVNESYEKRQLLSAGASKIILICASKYKLRSQLILLGKTRWWKPEVPHFIIDRSNKSCRNVEDILEISWRVNMINSIYICAESSNNSILNTMNPMGAYAPHPWQRREIFHEKFAKLHIFHQVFHAKNSCRYLNYDKTKLLHNYEVKIVEWPRMKTPINPRLNYIRYFNTLPSRNYKLLRSIMRVWNTSVRYELTKYNEGIMISFISGTADITASVTLLEWFPHIILGNHFPHDEETIIAVVRLKPEVSTLEKIGKLWSIQVLILAAIALALLAVILTIITRSFSSALLDVTRLLIYSGIAADNRGHAFRIYFTKMLIFMVISNGVFSGKIAAFLTTRERGDAPRTIDELERMQYEIYTRPGLENLIEKLLPKSIIKTAVVEECIQLVINSTDHVCFLPKSQFEQDYILDPLDSVEAHTGFIHFTSRPNWPLANRFDDTILRHIEAGIVDFWKIKDTMVQRNKREAIEAQWFSEEYRPVKLYKLKFAFQLLAIGLLLSTIVFFMELLAIKCKKVCRHCKNKVV